MNWINFRGGIMMERNKYPYILIERVGRDTQRITGRFSDLEKAHRGRLMSQLNNPDKTILLMNENTGKFLDWRKKELKLLQKYKNNPRGYFETLRG
ncbi:MAG: hypothetical protein ACOC2M_05040 [bacterium]